MSKFILNKKLSSIDDTKNMAEQLVASILDSLNSLKSNVIIYLHGDLGVGKTLFCNFFINSIRKYKSDNAEHSDFKIKSPTYTLIESYEFNNLTVHHLDLYRLADPDEFSFLGLDELFEQDNMIFLVEWPEKAQGLIPNSDVSIELDYINASDNANDNMRSIIIKSQIDLNNIK